MPEAKEEIDEYFSSVTAAIASSPGWSVTANICLSFFSFSKFVMYKDLDASAWPPGKSPADNPLIKATFAPETIAEDTRPVFCEDEIDIKLKVHDLYHVMDADPSQIAVIEELKIGRNLVVEGPPGTGKSQTITNAIAELLASGKTVLFVSEKMAALEVVKARLDKAGLGAFCLELHSRKTNKKEVLEELESSLKKGPSRSGKFTDELDELEKLKSELNHYAWILREPFGKIRFSPFALYCLRSKANQAFEVNERSAPKFLVNQVEGLSREAFFEHKGMLKDLSAVVSLVKPVHEHSWRFSKAKVVLPSDEEEIRKSLDEAISACQQLAQEVSAQYRILRASAQPTFGLVEHFVAAGLFLKDMETIDSAALNDSWESAPEPWTRPLNKVEEFQQLFSPIQKRFISGVLDKDLGAMRQELQTYSQKIFRIFDKRYRNLKKGISCLYQPKAPAALRRRLANLTKLEQCQLLRKDIGTLSGEGISLFGCNWKAELSDVGLLRRKVGATSLFRKLFKMGIFTKETLDVTNRSDVGSQTERLVAADRLFREKAGIFIEKVAANKDELLSESLPVDSLLKRLSQLKEEIPKLARWARYYSVREKCYSFPLLQPVVDLLERGDITEQEMLPALEVNVADALLKRVFNEYPALAAFVGDLHEKKITRFQELDQEMLKMNRVRLQSKLFQSRPPVTSGASPTSEAGILLGESSKKRRHMPIRKLLFHAGRLIQRIKPCFMMSPLSIAQFLDPRSINFDVVIFDEASQVKPADALGALLRGKQVTVMGDTKQLPPTSFFDHMSAGEDADFESADTNVTDVESILHLCKRSFPTKLLKWHYRSKHESLIAVSNQEFYDNELFVYPSSCHESPDIGLKFNPIFDSVYDRGRSSVNRKEAQAVAKAAAEHYRKWPNKSLGVGAFNIKQQQAILEEIELLLKLNPEMEDSFSSKQNEHFFVKNLETIQGDERDVIFLSVGFGFDETHQLSRNFGPLNQDGGQRRLNVLISRAREKCVVFSNFRASDLQLDANAPFGLRSLKCFLDYAENKVLKAAEVSSDDTDSPFEDAVYSFLVNNGYQVRKQVGCARFRIDLAVVDPSNPGRYLVGVECDGAKYHSSPVARDRDRLREQILRKLDWQIYRIWSTDWYRNRRDTEDKLLHAVKRLKESGSAPERSEAAKPSEDSSLKPSDEDGPENTIGTEKNLPQQISAPAYRSCQELPFKNRQDLHLQPPEKLALNVIHIVKEEGPIHAHEVIRRMRLLWGLGRTGDRIVAAIKQAIRLAVRQEQVEMKGKFLWPRNPKKIKARKRTEDPNPDIELICDEEIQEAVRLVLNAQFSTALEDLAIATSRLLGFQATRDDTSRKIQGVIRAMIVAAELEQMPTGAIHFANQS
jgi:very-short-patch-repair endonuclease